MSIINDLYWLGCLKCRDPWSYYQHTCGKATPSQLDVDWTKCWEDYFKRASEAGNIHAWEVDNLLFVEFDLPGRSLEEIHLKIDENKIKVDIEEHKYGDKAKWLVGGPRSKVTNEFVLNKKYDVSKAIATYSKGVLRISLQKIEPLKNTVVDLKIVEYP